MECKFHTRNFLVVTIMDPENIKKKTFGTTIRNFYLSILFLWIIKVVPTVTLVREKKTEN